MFRTHNPNITSTSPSISCRRFVARNIHKWRGSGNFCKITWKTFDK